MADLTIDQAKLLQRHRTEQILQAFKVATLVTVRERTPIDTGNARSRWAAEPAGLVSLGDTFTIGNDAEYIVALEYGKSRQAPQGMARIVAAESQQRMDDIVDGFGPTEAP